MQTIHEYAWIAPLLPSLAAASGGLGLLFFRAATRSLRNIYATLNIGMVVIAFVFSLLLVNEQLVDNTVYKHLWSWMKIGDFSIEVGFLIDPLSCIMLLLVTSVAVSVMVYTDGYMSHDQGYIRFFAYLSLFTASMLGLVLSPNLIQVYMFWELVGMCSYLLVGFWSARPTAAAASQKAFVTNRIGDFGLLLGILGFYWITDSFDFAIIAQKSHELIQNESINHSLFTLCCLLLFLGPVAKSAQFPLHVWLPDAMEGPTPISALIHAATMVAAGIFLVARLLPLFQYSPFTMNTIAWTGGVTAILGASIALAQMDLKRGLAYSTMSQLGYMMLAMGIGSYKASLFHLITHAYSKALLFLGSGSVIHAMEPVVGHHPNKCQDMRNMGGLNRYMPITATTFLLGTISLCGIPPFACFWSKDEILADSWVKAPVLGCLAWLTAGMTGFYMARIYLLTFKGDFRVSKKEFQSYHQYPVWEEEPLNHNVLNQPERIVDKHSSHSLWPQESGLSMVAPLVILAIPTLLIGLLGAPFPNGVSGSDLLSKWFHVVHNPLVARIENWGDFCSGSLPSVLISLVGISLAWLNYRSGYFLSAHIQDSNKNFAWATIIYKWSFYRGYIDSLYDYTFVNGTRIAAEIVSTIDRWGVDGLVNLAGLLTFFIGEGGRYGEGGRTSSYLFVLTAGTFSLLLAFWLIYPVHFELPRIAKIIVPIQLLTVAN